MAHYHIGTDEYVGLCTPDLHEAANRLAVERSTVIRGLEDSCERGHCGFCRWCTSATKANEAVSSEVIIPMARAELRMRPDARPTWYFETPTSRTCIWIRPEESDQASCQHPVATAQRARKMDRELPADWSAVKFRPSPEQAVEAVKEFNRRFPEVAAWKDEVVGR